MLKRRYVFLIIIKTNRHFLDLRTFYIKLIKWWCCREDIRIHDGVFLFIINLIREFFTKNTLFDVFSVFMFVTHEKQVWGRSRPKQRDVFPLLSFKLYYRFWFFLFFLTMISRFVAQSICYLEKSTLKKRYPDFNGNIQNQSLHFFIYLLLHYNPVSYTIYWLYITLFFPAVVLQTVFWAILVCISQYLFLEKESMSCASYWQFFLVTKRVSLFRTLVLEILSFYSYTTISKTLSMEVNTIIFN